MATTRNFKSLGIFAENADTDISSPAQGSAYRDTNTTEADNETGVLYGSEANSLTFNQKLFIISSFTDLIDSHGIPGWNEDVDYTLPAVVWGTSNQFYVALQNSGPSYGGAKDPTLEPDYWSDLPISSNLADQTVGGEGTRLVGHTGFTAASFLPFARCRIDSTDGVTAVISQNFNIASAVRNSTGDASVTFSNSQPSTEYQVFIQVNNEGATNMPHVTNQYEQLTTGFSYRTWEVAGGASLQDEIVDIIVYPGQPLT